MKKLVLFLALLIGISPSLWAQDFLKRKVVEIGKPVPDFQLSDSWGKAIKLSDYKGKVVMIHFWSATCPFVVRYEPRLQALTKEYASKDVVVLGIDSNADESVAQIRKVASKRDVNYPILIDSDSKIADAFGAITTPHIYVVNREGLLVYEGSVDDQGWSESASVTKQYARDAIEAALAGKAVPSPKTQTFGCSIKRPSSS